MIMQYVEFNPDKHRSAFAKGRLYERQTRVAKKILVDYWMKVTKESVYEDALSNPIFFAVRDASVVEAKLRQDLVLSLTDYQEDLGGPGSGHHGHKETPGSQGGSAAGGGIWSG